MLMSESVIFITFSQFTYPGKFLLMLTHMLLKHDADLLRLTHTLLRHVLLMHDFTYAYSQILMLA